MKKIKIAVCSIASILVLLVFISSKAEAQGTKGVDPLFVHWNVNKDLNYPCRFNITLTLDVYGLSGNNTFTLPHGLGIDISGGSINGVGSKTETPATNHWFVNCKQVPNSITGNLSGIFWIKQVHCGTIEADVQKNRIPSSDLLTIPIDVTPSTTNGGVITFNLYLILGVAWPYDNTLPLNPFVNCSTLSNNTVPPSQIQYVCKDGLKSIPKNEQNPNYKIYCDAANNYICSLCPPVTSSDAVLKLFPTPPAGSKVEWFKYIGTCPSTLSGTPFATVASSLATGVTCPTGGPLDQTTCWMALVTTGCYSYVSASATIYVCKPACPITADSIAPARSLQSINNEWHVCSSWNGTLKITTFNCPTTVSWWKRIVPPGPPPPFTNVYNCNYTPTNPCGLTFNTGPLQGPPINGPCSIIYEYMVKYTNACGTNSCTFKIYVDRPTQKGKITADLLLLGFGTINGPILCFHKFTNLQYFQAPGACEKVLYWQKSVNTAPCGMGNNWTQWEKIPGSSNGPSPTWATNLLDSTTRYKVIVKALSCDTLSSNPIIVKILPPLTVTLSANSSCPDLCNPPVLLTANVPCANAYLGITYRWYNQVGSVSYLVSTTTVPTFTPLQAGDYYVVITSNPNCGTAQSNKIRVCGRPCVHISGPCGLCKDEKGTLAAIITCTGCDCQTYTYLWSNGETTQSIIVNAPTGTTPVPYSVTITNGTCTASATFQLKPCPPSQKP